MCAEWRFHDTPAANSVVRGLGVSETARVLFTGGGTGGHLFPGIAVAERLTGRVAAIGFVGTGSRLERSEAQVRGFDYFSVPAVSSSDLRRRPLRSLWCGWRSYRRAATVIEEFRPTAVVGLGGYASVPLAWAAFRRRIPVTLLEQNVIPGRATRLLSRWANRVCVSFAETQRCLPRMRECRWTGNPVRHCRVDAEKAPGDSVVLVLGGSQGASSLNEAMPEVLAKCLPVESGWKVVHQSGRGDAAAIRRAYLVGGVQARVEPFLENVQQWLGSADLVVARAGATTLAEMACAGSTGILVPYPSAADDHQRANAMWYVRRGAARIVEETSGRDALVEGLVREVALLLGSREDRRRLGVAMRNSSQPDAAAAVVSVLNEDLSLPNAA